MAGNLQYDANLLPNTTGLDLGSPSQRWDLFGNNLDIVGTISGTTYSCDTTLGFSAAVNAAITALPSTGGIVDATGFTGSQTASSTITISKPIRLLLGGVTVTAPVSPLFTVSSQFELKGWGRNTTTLISSSGGAIATFSGTAIKWLHWSNLKLSGGATTSSVFSIADYSGGVFDMSQGMYVFENLWVNGFGGDATSLAAMSFGQSTYWIRIIGCTFTDNKVDLKFARYCEAEIFSNQFYNLTANSTQLRHLWLVGGSSIFRVCANDFENNGATSATEDIRIDANGDGNWWIVDNKFGSEGDIASRAKIKFTTSGGAQAIGLKIVGNEFLAGAGLANTAISIAGSIESIRVDGNVFYTSGFAKLVDDSFTPISNSGGQGHSSFKDNRIYSLGTGDFTVFTNAGRGFADLQDLTAGTESNSGYIQTMYEPPSLSNRLTFSEAFNSWTANSVTVTTGQADPFGTTRACLLTKQGGASNSILLQFTPTISRMTFSLWAKSGTASKLQVGIYNLTTGNFLEVRTFLLVGTFQRYKFTLGGIDTAVNYRFYIYPDGQDATAKTCTVFGAQAADFDSGYVRTTGTIISDTAYGTNYHRRLSFDPGAGIYGEPVAGANVAGNNLVICGGISTGNQTGGNITLQASPSGGAGSGANTPGNRVVVNSGVVSVTNVPLCLSNITAFASLDTTPSVAVGNIFTTANAGATVITQLDDGQAGQTVTIIFGDANTTLNDGGNFKLSANMVSTADDVLTLTTVNGTTWYEISRSVN